MMRPGSGVGCGPSHFGLKGGRDGQCKSTGISGRPPSRLAPIGDPSSAIGPGTRRTQYFAKSASFDAHSVNPARRSAASYSDLLDQRGCSGSLCPAAATGCSVLACSFACALSMSGLKTHVA